MNVSANPVLSRLPKPRLGLLVSIFSSQDRHGAAQGLQILCGGLQQGTNKAEDSSEIFQEPAKVLSGTSVVMVEAAFSGGACERFLNQCTFMELQLHTRHSLNNGLAWTSFCN